MSEPKDHNDPEQEMLEVHNQPEKEMPELPSNEHIGANVDDDDLQSLLQNHVDEQNSQLQTEVNFIINPRFSGNPLEPDSAEQNIKETAIPSQLQTGAEVPISMNQTDKDSVKPGDEVHVSMNQTENDSEKPGDEIPVSMNQTRNDSEKRGDEIALFMNETDSDSEKTGDEVPAFRNQTENGSEKTGDELHAFMNQTQSDSEKTGDGDPISLNQTENNSAKTSDEVPFFMNQVENDSERNDAFDVKNEMESEMVNTSLDDDSNSLESDVKAAHSEDNYSTETPLKQERAKGEQPAPIESSNQSFTFDYFLDGDDSGTEEEQAAFMKELENFFRERSMEFKPPKFYGEGLNCLKLWRAVTKLGGYDRALLEYEKHKIRTGKLQIPISDLPEAMVIDNQRTDVPSAIEIRNIVKVEDFIHSDASNLGQLTEPIGTKIQYPYFQLVFNFEEVEHPSRLIWYSQVGFVPFWAWSIKSRDMLSKVADSVVGLNGIVSRHFCFMKGGGNQASGSGRARRDAAARAMQGWHSQRLLGNGEVGDPIIKDKSSISLLKRDKHLKSNGAHKRKKPSNLEPESKVARSGLPWMLLTPDVDGVVNIFFVLHKAANEQQIILLGGADTTVVDVGAPADWVKINVRQTVQVQSDPAGRLIISGEPEQPDNPWGVTPFKKVITLPSRIDPHQTSAVVTLHGQLFVRAPFDQSDL
ncbi:hypothetical protein COCNU_11G010310 [Cocos nucifera]|uniref:ARID domain-containing protein n=1 Tax=Cocos nucifera TaxID=13894 RepID=A0A8K0N9N5_COCNU|nr:hypothetical protein COCNU_11G010310 [Cocos nucifera]